MSTSNLIDEMISQAKLSKKHTAKQQKVVDAAIKIFAEKGFANTSTSEIAEQAGVAEATIFRHYGTKENLLLSVILPFIKDFIPRMADEIFNGLLSQNPATFEQFLRALIKNRIDFISDNRKLFQILVKEVMYREEFKQELAPLVSEIIIHHFNKVIETFKEREDLIDKPTPILIRMLLTFLYGYFTSRYVLITDNFVKNEEEEVDEVVRFIMGGLRKPV
ncbi:TetR/AcrR family transcriptional regulator [Metabacillus sp. RGM 3146]|uniref:TetR/AcrR family transcriptional regulator n=1 Tax=Metabacillus sp. RGM 3146 TaxID=3401092 RepID=UPI003B9B5876